MKQQCTTVTVDGGNGSDPGNGGEEGGINIQQLVVGAVVSFAVARALGDE